MKKKILDASGDEVCLVPEITGCSPVGSQILVELLTAQELYNTRLTITKKVAEGFQGYIRATGPSVKTADWGFKVADRVVVSGGGVPVPNYDNNERDRVLMEPHSIKCVLCEK